MGFMPDEVTTIDALPLQASMVEQQQADPSSTVYSQLFLARLAQPMPEDRLRRAWQQLVARHEAMRASFHRDSDGTWRQRIAPEAAIEVQVEDWSTLAPNQRPTRLQAVRRDFDVGRAPLHRIELFQERNGPPVLCWVSHHAVIDRASGTVLLDEMLELCAHENAPLPPAPSWIEFVRRARNVTPNSEQFWKSWLDGQQTALFGSPSRPPSSSVAGTSAVLDATQLEPLCRAANVTPTIVLGAAWALTLSRLVGQSSVVFGVIRACRQNQRLVGLVMNILPMRVEVPGALTVEAWLQKLRRDWHAMRPYERTSLPDIRRFCGATPDTALFDTLVSIDPPPPHRPAIMNWELHGRTAYPLFLRLQMTTPMRLGLQYDTSLVEPALAGALLEQAVSAIQGMCAAPQGKVSDLPVTGAPMLPRG
jgi:hypothetical protein